MRKYLYLFLRYAQNINPFLYPFLKEICYFFGFFSRMFQQKILIREKNDFWVTIC